MSLRVAVKPATNSINVAVASSTLAAVSRFPATAAAPARSTSVAAVQRRLCEISRRKVATVAHVSI